MKQIKNTILLIFVITLLSFSNFYSLFIDSLNNTKDSLYKSDYGYYNIIQIKKNLELITQHYSDADNRQELFNYLNDYKDNNPSSLHTKFYEYFITIDNIQNFHCALERTNVIYNYFVINKKPHSIAFIYKPYRIYLIVDEAIICVDKTSKKYSNETNPDQCDLDIFIYNINNILNSVKKYFELKKNNSNQEKINDFYSDITNNEFHSNIHKEIIKKIIYQLDSSTKL